ncbi:TAXI family TRAP transporter solute-binding subunit [Fusobacterium sp. MFO224]|uniref:TAXI family TRAP transporter solute-binding subunit n=1 Tax=Fusobacterium sp. MFO224 TaxID=3378070 RepID=UPI003851E4C1
MNRKSIISLIIVTISLIFTIGCTREEENNIDKNKKEEVNNFLTIATGPTSGLYYPIGTSFAKVLKKVGYRTSVQSTGGSVENINLILTKAADLAIAMSDSVDQSKETKELRALTGLYPNYVQLVTIKKNKIRKFEDLKGKRVGIGAFNSGVELNARMMYEAHGMSYEDSVVQYLNYGDAVEKMKNGLVDAIFVTSGIPNETIMELKTDSDIVLVPITGKGMINLRKKYPFFVEDVIPAEIYGTDRDIKTVSVRNIMLVRKDLPEDVVYEITKGIFDNIKSIKASHVTSKQNISLENSQIGVKIPFHPGAIKYYKEQGVVK